MLLRTIFLSLISVFVNFPFVGLAKDNADIIPKGITRFRGVYVNTGSINNQFNADSKLAGLTSSLNRPVTMKALAATNEDMATLVKGLNNLSPGLGDDLASANLFSDYSLTQNIFLVAAEYAPIKNLNIGFRIPIVSKTINANFQVDSSQNAAAIRKEVESTGSQALINGINQFTDATGKFDTAFFENELFTKKGYKSPRNISQTDIGDLEFGFKYQYFSNEYWKLATTLGARAPTGSTTPIDDPFNKGVGKGTWGTAIKLHQDFWPTSNIVLGSLAKISYNFSDTKQRAVPKDENDALPSLQPGDDQVHDIERQTAMEYLGELSAEVFFRDKTFSTFTAVQYTTQGESNFSGGPANLCVSCLNKNTDFYSTTAELGVSYSTIPAFRKKKFPIPMQVSAMWNETLRGKNTPDLGYGRLDVKFYF